MQIYTTQLLNWIGLWCLWGESKYFCLRKSLRSDYQKDNELEFSLKVRTSKFVHFGVLDVFVLIIYTFTPRPLTC